jgi:hypothetical protein
MVQFKMLLIFVQFVQGQTNGQASQAAAWDANLKATLKMSQEYSEMWC